MRNKENESILSNELKQRLCDGIREDIKKYVSHEMTIFNFGVRNRNNQIFMKPQKFDINNIPIRSDIERIPIIPQSFSVKAVNITSIVDKLEYEWQKQMLLKYKNVSVFGKSWWWISPLMRDRNNFDILKEDLLNTKRVNMKNVIYWNTYALLERRKS